MAHASILLPAPLPASPAPPSSADAPPDARLLAALALIHDALKEVDCVHQLAARLAALPEPASEHAAQDAAAVAELARGLVARLRGFLDGETAGEVAARRPLGELVERAVARTALVRPAARFRLELADDAAALPLPEAVSDLLVPLLDNAATHGASRAPVRVCARCSGERLELAVVDAGPGMRAETLRDCLALGYTTAHRRGHRGIGLAAAAALARQLGGALRLESRHGQGTTATLALPAARA